MKNRKEDPQREEPDRHLDVPAEANRERHINFLEVEEESAGREDRRHDDEETRRRREQWQEGLEEGRRARRGHSDTARKEDVDPEST